MINIYIWDGFHGHASLEIIDHKSDKKTYVSFHPQGNKLLQTIGAATVGSSAIYIKSYQDDKEIMERPANHTIELKNMKEKSILNFLVKKSIIPGNASNWSNRYHLLANNCSHIIAQCLTVGMIGNDNIGWWRLHKEMDKLFSKVIYVKVSRVRIEGRPASKLHYFGAYTSEGKPEIRNALEISTTVLMGTGVAGLALGLAGISIAFPFALALAPGIILTFVSDSQNEIVKWDPFWVHNLALYMKKNIG